MSWGVRIIHCRYITAVMKWAILKTYERSAVQVREGTVLTGFSHLFIALTKLHDTITLQGGIQDLGMRWQLCYEQYWS
jgi:hypothetical protein